MAYTDLWAAPGRLCAAAESRALLQPSRLTCTSCRAHADHASTSGRLSSDSYSYNSGSPTDRQKATIEHVYEGDERRKGPPSPWTLGWQMNERNLVWNDDLKARLLMRTMKQEMGLGDAEVQERLIKLVTLLPGLLSKLPVIKAKVVITLAEDISALAQKLMQIKAVFPEADAAKVFLEQPYYFLATNLHTMEGSVARLQSILPEVHIDRLINEHPQILDVDSFEKAVREAKHIMPDMNISHMMRMNPSMIFSFQRGSSLIPYDEVPS